MGIRDCQSMEREKYERVPFFYLTEKHVSPIGSKKAMSLEIFLIDPLTNELGTVVAPGIEEKMIGRKHFEKN